MEARRCIAEQTTCSCCCLLQVMLMLLLLLLLHLLMRLLRPKSVAKRRARIVKRVKTRCVLLMRRMLV